MKTDRTIILFFSLLIFGLLSSACTGRTLTASSWPGLLATEDTAYVAYNSHVYAINIDAGTLKWQYPTEADRNLTFFAEPVQTGTGQIIVGDYHDSLHLLNETTGQEEVGSGAWPFDQASNRYISGPAVTDLGIFAPSADGSLYALDFQANTLWGPFETDGPLWAKPAVDGDRLYLPSMDHFLYALNARTGRTDWSMDLIGAIVGTPTVSEDGIIYVGSFNSELVALETETGRIVWRTPTTDWVWSGPTLEGEQLYFGDVSGLLYCLSREDGSQQWTYQADGAIAGKPLVTEDTVYITTEAGTLIALTIDGAVKWTQAVGGKLYSSPKIVGEIILVTPVEADAILSAYTVNGAQAWTYAPEE